MRGVKKIGPRHCPECGEYPFRRYRTTEGVLRYCDGCGFSSLEGNAPAMLIALAQVRPDAARAWYDVGCDEE